MSSVMIVKLKRKEQSPEEAIVLLEMSTTPTRQLRDAVNLSEGYGEYVTLTESKLNEIFDYYSNEIDSLNKSIVDVKKENLTLETRMWNITTTEIYERIAEQYNNNVESCNYFEEELVYNKGLREEWYAVKRIFDLNYNPNRVGEFELIYYTD